jgi:hypothetical protein
MTGGAKASYSKYPVVGDASVVRRAFALFIESSAAPSPSSSTRSSCSSPT